MITGEELYNKVVDQIRQSDLHCSYAIEWEGDHYDEFETESQIADTAKEISLIVVEQMTNLYQETIEHLSTIDPGAKIHKHLLQMKEDINLIK